MCSRNCIGAFSVLVAALSMYLYYITPIRQPVVVIFGDSFSDAGNGLYPQFQEIGVSYPTKPYAGGRFTNGPIWTEYLEDFLNWRVHNYAISCARVAHDFLFCVDMKQESCVLVRSVKRQLERFLEIRGPSWVIPKHYVFIVQGGGNNMLDTIGGGYEQEKFYRNMAGNYSEIGRRLLDAGAQHILFMNLPIPQQILNPLTAQFVSVINLIQQANDEAVEELQRAYPGRAIGLIDASDEVDQIANEFRSQGKSVRYPCVTSVSVANGILDYYFNIHVDYKGCSKPENYMMWDEIHFTTDVHKKLAQAIARYVKSNFYLQFQHPVQRHGPLKAIDDYAKEFQQFSNSMLDKFQQTVFDK